MNQKEEDSEVIASTWIVSSLKVSENILFCPIHLNSLDFLTSQISF